MSRPIKFRAWDKKYPRFIEVGIEWGLSSNPLRIDRIDDFVFQEFTGLRDKNGVEVYEGDILRVPAKDEYEKTTYNSFEVFYHDNDHTPTDCGLVLGRLTPHGNSAGGYSGYKLIPKHVGMMEVIGNIYEHPHLLNPTEQENK